MSISNTRSRRSLSENQYIYCFVIKVDLKILLWRNRVSFLPQVIAQYKHIINGIVYSSIKTYLFAFYLSFIRYNSSHIRCNITETLYLLRFYTEIIYEIEIIYIRYSNFANFDDLYETKLKNCCLKYVIRLKTEIYQKFYHRLCIYSTKGNKKKY